MPAPDSGSAVVNSVPWSVTKWAVQPGAPVTSSRTVTGLSASTRSRSPMPAWPPRPPEAPKERLTADDSAMYECPDRMPATIASRESSSARTTVCGSPTLSGSRCASLLPIAGTHGFDARTAATRELSHSASAISSSGVYGPFHTSTASASPKPNFQWQPMQVACGWAGTTRPPARRTAFAYCPKRLSRAR